MKRWIAFILALCTLCSLAGCKKEEPEAQTEATEQPPIQALYTPEPSAEPEPTEAAMIGEEAQQALSSNIGGGEGTLDEIAPPGSITFATEPPEDALPWDDEPIETENTPMPEYTPAPDDPYTYSSLTNKTLKVKFLYPEGWTSDPSTDTITMVEPVPEGEVPARFSVTSFEYTYNERDISTGRLKNHLTDYLKGLVGGYNEYQLGETGYELSFAESTSIYARYLAIKGNSYIEGIAAVGYGKNGRVYCMHFCCEQDDYEGHADLIEKLAANVTPTK